MSQRPSYAQSAAALLALALCASTIYGCIAWFDESPAEASDEELVESFQFDRGTYHLPGPSARSANAGPRIRNTQIDAEAGRWIALAYQYSSPVLERPHPKAKALASVRRGTRVRAVERASGKGCKHGWYRLAEGGFVCNKSGFLVSSEKRSFWIRQPAVDLNRPLFYRYARVTTPGALRLTRLPGAADQKQLDALLLHGRTGKLPDFVQARMEGDYFVALDRIESSGKQRYFRTVRGRYVRVEDVELRPAPKMHGVHLGGDKTLPWAFVYGDSPALLLRKQKGRFEKVGTAEPHGSFPLHGVESRREREYAVGPRQFAVSLDRVRVARRIRRPSGITAKQKWVHIDLTSQTLVAYEGDQPVFATLVSTGKEETGHKTPTGLYRITDKHVSVTMSGDDRVEGHYEVAEVPWTQFYDGSYALHGAYWHDTFGSTRSHGCTNLSPPDARWLFYWTYPKVPPGFHARRRATGTAVYVSQQKP